MEQYLYSPNYLLLPVDQLLKTITKTARPESQTQRVTQRLHALTSPLQTYALCLALLRSGGFRAGFHGSDVVGLNPRYVFGGVKLIAQVPRP